MKADMLAELANLFAAEADEAQAKNAVEAKRLRNIAHELFDKCLEADIREGFFDKVGE